MNNIKKNIKNIISVSGIVLMASVGVACAQQIVAPAPAVASSNVGRFYGVISSLGQSSFTLTSTTGKSVSVNTASVSTVLANNQPLALSALADGMQASVYGAREGTTTIDASIVIADSVGISGVITSVSGNSFAMTSGKSSFVIDPVRGASVIIDRAPSSVSSLAAGMTATVYGVWTDQSRTAVSAISIESNHAGIGGRVGQVNGNGFILVDGNGKQHAVDLMSSAILTVAGSPATLADVTAGAPVSAYGFWTDPTEATLDANAVFVNGKGMTASTTGWCYGFYDDLRVGAQGPDVSNLQIALNQSGFDVQDTGYFDQSTASAVSGFQERYASAILAPNGLTYGTGYVGPSTRAKLNSLYGCSNPLNGQGGDGSSDYTNWSDGQNR